jgi:beta-aspartyl-peptidase (threonine type)
LGIYAIAAHGGAGVKIPRKRSQGAVEEALLQGYRLLEDGGTALDAVERVIVGLEDHPDFNAGTGSRIQLDGVIRMDASIMEGDQLRAGAVAAIEDIKNPIRAARAVMEKTGHVMLVGKNAKRFALLHGMEEADVYTERRRKIWKKSLEASHKHIDILRRGWGCGTVGAVAIDRKGCIASGSSTGGALLMLPGRVGDTPIIGAGIYADSAVGAVSATGIGEFIMRTAFSKSAVEQMSRGSTPTRALKEVTAYLNRVTGGEVGAIALDAKGRIGVWHSTRYMYYSYRISGRDVKTGARVE